MRRGIRPTTLVLTAALAGVLGLLVAVLITRDGSLLPKPPVVAALLLLVMAGVVVIAARPVRRYLEGRAERPLDAIQAARTVVLAQAAALTGAAVVGWEVGQLAVILAGLDLVANRERLLPLLLVIGCALVLGGAGLLAQHWCRVDPPEDDEGGTAG